MPDDYDRQDDIRKSVEFAYAVIRERVARGGHGWGGYGPAAPMTPRARFIEIVVGIAITGLLFGVGDIIHQLALVR